MIRFGIRLRLTAGILSSVILISMVIVGYFSVHNRQSDKEGAINLINNTCDKISSEIVGRLNVGLGRTRALVGTFDASNALNSTNRDSLIFPFLRNGMKANKDYLAFWISLE